MRWNGSSNRIADLHRGPCWKPCYAGPDVDTAPIHRSYFVRSKSGRRTDLNDQTFLKETYHPDLTGKVSLWGDYTWKVRPVMGTNLWAGETYRFLENTIVSSQSTR